MFQRKMEEKIDSYYNNIQMPNVKNNSFNVKGILGGGGMFPDLNVSKREGDSGGESTKYMTPALL